MEFLFASFAFVNLDNTSSEEYDYVGFISRTGKTLIIRYNKEGTEAKYHLSNSIYNDLWEHRTELEYKLPHELKGIF
jgi:hypothetical protein